MEKGRIVIIAGGTGNPFFTTDSAAALRATELGSEIVLKGTKVDGVYDKDPAQYSNAKKYEHLTYDKVIQDNLPVKDMTAIHCIVTQDLSNNDVSSYYGDQLIDGIKKLESANATITFFFILKYIF